MALLQLFLIHRYEAEALHYLTPTPDNEMQTEAMKRLGIFTDVEAEVGEIIVADVNKEPGRRAARRGRGGAGEVHSQDRAAAQLECLLGE